MRSGRRLDWGHSSTRPGKVKAPANAAPQRRVKAPGVHVTIGVEEVSGVLYRQSPPKPEESEAPPLPESRRDLLAAIRELVGEVAEVPPERRRYLLQSLGGAVQADLAALYQVLSYLKQRAADAERPADRIACACGAVTTPGIICPRCGTLAE